MTLTAVKVDGKVVWVHASHVKPDIGPPPVDQFSWSMARINNPLKLKLTWQGTENLKPLDFSGDYGSGLIPKAGCWNKSPPGSQSDLEHTLTGDEVVKITQDHPPFT